MSQIYIKINMDCGAFVCIYKGLQKYRIKKGTLISNHAPGNRLAMFVETQKTS